MPISTIFTALFYPYIAQEQTAQSKILSVRSERFALCLKERHRSQNQSSLKSDWAISKSNVPSSELNTYMKECLYFVATANSAAISAVGSGHNLLT